LAALKKSIRLDKCMVGSVPWLAPEIVLGTGDYSKASDVYSLGLILYELVTGKVPYFDLPNKPARPSGEEIRDWIKEGYRPWKYLPKTCPSQLADLIFYCCAEDPKGRPSAHVIVLRFQSLKSKATISISSPTMSVQNMKENTSIDPELPLNLLESMLPTFEKGTSFNVVNKDGESPLHRAVKVRNVRLVKGLLGHAARIDLCDKHGMTPLRLAQNLGDESLVSLLMK